MVSKIRLNEDNPADPYPLYSDSPIPPKPAGTKRVWLDGCFDFFHYGHANVIRRALRYGDEIYIGCHSDKEIELIKGTPIVAEEDRYHTLRSCKWVTKVVENYPYSTRIQDMRKFEIEYVVHGSDV